MANDTLPPLTVDEIAELERLNRGFIVDHIGRLEGLDGITIADLDALVYCRLLVAALPRLLAERRAMQDVSATKLPGVFASDPPIPASVTLPLRDAIPRLREIAYHRHQEALVADGIDAWECARDAAAITAVLAALDSLPTPPAEGRA